MRHNVIICECVHSALIDQGKLQTLRASLEAARIPFTMVPDLCGMAAMKDPFLKQLASRPESQILACYPRAIRALFKFGDAPLAPEGVKLINLREASIESALGSLDLPAVTAEGAPEKDSPEQADSSWIPWFPVIDSERCSQCQQCLGFCLFGVYALAPDGKVIVQQPNACKTNCPACARICPQVAIIFPKYEAGAIAGAEITDEEKEKSRVQADLKKVLGSDVYKGLAERRQKARQRQLLRTDVVLSAREPYLPLRSSSEPGPIRPEKPAVSPITPAPDGALDSSSQRP